MLKLLHLLFHVWSFQLKQFPVTIQESMLAFIFMVTWH